ncbi:MAG: hypothetical protein JO170_22125 [Verrucomicrobia bacterium]|nr:hypothetical protein [Verrucomicrobiota bacterium]
MTVATFAGCVIHYQYQAKIIEIRLPQRDHRVTVWRRIDRVVESLGYSLSGASALPPESHTYSRPLRFFSPPSRISVVFDQKSNVLWVKKIAVGQTKGVSSWDVDSRVQPLRDKLAEALPETTVSIVTIQAEGQADLFPLGDNRPTLVPIGLTTASAER